MMPRPSVSVITTVSFSKVTGVWVADSTFFQGQDEQEQQGKDLRVLMLHALGRGSNTGQECYQSTSKPEEKVTSVNFSMIHSVHEPQGFAGKPPKQLKSYKETSEVKILLMNFISRLARIHKLFCPIVHRFLSAAAPRGGTRPFLLALPTSLYLVVPEDHWGAAQDHATHSVMTRTLGKSWQEEVMPWER